MDDRIFSIPVTPPTQNNLSENVAIEDTLGHINISIKTKKRWGWFIAEILQWIVVGLCFFPLAVVVILSILQTYLPETARIFIWILVGGLTLYLLYKKFLEAIEYIFDREFIEIDNQSVKVEKHGLIFRKKMEYPAERIRYIMPFTLGGNSTGLLRFMFNNKNIDAFFILHNKSLKMISPFGRGIEAADARIILEMIYTKFPQYKGETS